MNISNSFSNDVENLSLPYLLFTIGKNIYGISSEFVRSIERLGEIIVIADSEPDIRGGVLYQDDFIYLIDMRRLLGLDSQIDEFEKNVQPEQRIKDHENWVLALEKSVKDHTDFLLTDDPKQCQFGRWYYAFKTDNNLLRHQLHAIESPHEAIHNTAKLVKELTARGDYEAAMSAIKEMRDTHYKTTISTLSSLRKIVTDNLKELYIVIDSGGGTKGIIVDAIIGVEYLDNTLQIPESMHGAKYIQCLGRRKNDNTIVILLNNLL